MVLTKSELVASLQNDVRILQHLASNVDRSMLACRPALGTRNLWGGVDPPPEAT